MKQYFSTQQHKKIALTGYFSLLIYMPLWLLWLNPSDSLSPTLNMIFFVIPLLFPLKGMIQGNPYTFAWSNFIVMWYFLHGLTTLWVSSTDFFWAIVELVFATMMFISGTYYAKYRGQELGLSLRKTKDKEQ